MEVTRVCTSRASIIPFLIIPILLGATTCEAQAPQFVGSWTVACCPDDISSNIHNQVYVADSNRYLRKFDNLGHQLFLLALPTGRVSGVDVARDGTMFLVNEHADVCHEFAYTGDMVRTWGGNGSGDGQFDRPKRIARDDDGNLYVTEWGNDRLQKFDSSGSFLAKWDWGGRGGPTGVSVGPDGYLYVVLSSEGLLWKMTRDLQFVDSWAVGGRPRGVHAADNGLVHVVDLNSAVETYDSTGQLLARWGLAT